VAIAALCNRARAFYASMGYADVGHMMYNFGGNSYGNRVLVKVLSS
jgi:hypothetical protein